MFKGTLINVEILVGLPGSGKTYYAENLSGCNKEHIVDFDRYKDSKANLRYILHNKFLFEYLFLYTPEPRVIFDGLFLTNKAQINIVKEWFDLFKSEDDLQNCKTNIKFVYFKEDREACLVNDSFRDKDRRANITIKHAEFEKPNIEEFKRFFQDERITFEIEEREVHKMSKYEAFIKKYKSEYYCVHGNYICSEKWSKGGTWCDYRGNEGIIEPDETPEYFKEFDELIEEYYPDITHMEYRKLYNSCVTIGDYYEPDYYGGTEYFEYYRCNLDALYNYLEEKGKI